MKLIPSLLCAACLAAAPVAAVLADPPAHAPAHGYRAKQRYVYYPSREVYYAPDSRMWFWLDGGDWQVGVNLPAYYQQYTTGGVSIELGTDRPYTEHSYVVRQYGGKSKAGKGYSSASGGHEAHHGSGASKGQGAKGDKGAKGKGNGKGKE